MKSRVRSQVLAGVFTAAVAVGLALLAGTARGDDSPTFNVQVIQPFKVGDRVRMQRNVDETLGDAVTVGRSGPQRQLSEMKLVFSGTLEALAVDGDGVPTRWKVKGEVATVRQPGTKSHEELVKPGTEFTVEWSGAKASVSAHDRDHPLSELATKFLPLVFEASGGGGEASLNRMLRPSKPVAAGASWKIDTKAAVEHLHAFDGKLKPADVIGTARLKALADSDEKEKKALVVEYEYTAKSKSPTGAPHGMTAVGPAVREESGSFTIPTDLSTGYFSAKATIRLVGAFKKMETEKKPVRIRTGLTTSKTVNREIKVEEDAAITEVIKLSTILTYERFGGVDKTTPTSTAARSSSSRNQ